MYSVIRRISSVYPHRYCSATGVLLKLQGRYSNLEPNLGAGALTTWRIQYTPTPLLAIRLKPMENIHFWEGAWNGIFPSCIWIVKSVQEQRHITPVRDLGGIFASKILTIWSRCPPEILSVTLLENNLVKFASWNWQRYRYISPAPSQKFTFICESFLDHLEHKRNKL
jgi:hypothetical protein